MSNRSSHLPSAPETARRRRHGRTIRTLAAVASIAALASACDVGTEGQPPQDEQFDDVLLGLVEECEFDAAACVELGHSTEPGSADHAFAMSCGGRPWLEFPCVEIEFDPAPEPAPEPEPHPQPEPRPEPEPQPQPEPAPQPQPQPDVAGYEALWQAVGWDVQDWAIDVFQRSAFVSETAAWHPVTFENVVAGTTRCGDRTLGWTPGIYCSRDQYVGFSHDVLLGWREAYGDLVVATVVAHEWAHAVQDMIGFGELSRYVIGLEAHADCLAGDYVRRALSGAVSGVAVTQQDLEQLFRFFDEVLGDDLPWEHPDAHGSSEFRADHFRQGLDFGVGGCTVYYEDA